MISLKRMFFSWSLRLLLAVLLIRLVWRFVTSVLSSARGSRYRPRERSVALVRDPVCGTYVEPSRSLSSSKGATTHYFCSESCQQTFLNTA